MRFWLTTLLALCLAITACAAGPTVSKASIPIPPFFANARVIRHIDLRSSVVREEIAVRARNIVDRAVKKYYVAIPDAAERHVAHFVAFSWETKTELPLEKIGYDLKKRHHMYKIALENPVQPEEDVKIGLKMFYTNVLAPLPAKIPQVARQHLLYKGNGYFYSPYPTGEVKTTLQFPTNNIVSHTGDKAQQSDSKLVYGPYQTIAPESLHLIGCHFESIDAILSVKQLRRDIELSHWAGNMAVEEHYELHNSGAELEQPFSRSTYMQTGHVHHQTNVLKELRLVLPASARDAYFRDTIGNVSTSHFRTEKEKSVLEIRPRYPLFGGWNYSWYHGYNADLSSFLHRTKDGKFILNVNFVENIEKMAVEEVETRIILPEGATNVQVHTPVSLDTVEHKVHHTYFDSTGRHMVVLKKRNVVQEHVVPVQILYEYPTLRLYQKPLVASLAFFSLFVISMVVSRLTFTIGSKKLKGE